MRFPEWAGEVRALYLRDPDMSVEEFERLYEVALRGERPLHPDLPAYLPAYLPGVEGMETAGVWQ